MAKKVVNQLKLQIVGGRATPAPPIGPALGQAGVNIMEFCKAFNAQTANREGELIPVEITVYQDKTFSFVCKTPPVAYLLKKAAGIEKGSGQAGKEFVATLSMSQIEKIAQQKLEDLNTHNLQGAINIVLGTARSMGIKVQ